MTAKKNHAAPAAASCADDTPTISPIIGEGSAAHRLVRVGRWSFTAQVGEEEPRIRDLDLAERLGYERPRAIRDLIGRMVSSGKLKDSELCRAVRQTSGRPAEETWLTEAQALKVTAKSETPTADAILDEVIRVFMLARRGLLDARPANDTGVSIAIAPLVSAMETIGRATEANGKAIESMTMIFAAHARRLDMLEGRRASADDTPGIGPAGALKILGTLRAIAATKAGAIGQGGNGKARNRLRFLEERTLRRELSYPMDRGCSWRKLSEGQFGRAMLILERMTAEADDMARLAARDAGPLFRAVPKAS